jgi:hypothetical protein
MADDHNAAEPEDASTIPLGDLLDEADITQAEIDAADDDDRARQTIALIACVMSLILCLILLVVVIL